MLKSPSKLISEYKDKITNEEYKIKVCTANINFYKNKLEMIKNKYPTLF